MQRVRSTHQNKKSKFIPLIVESLFFRRKRSLFRRIRHSKRRAQKCILKTIFTSRWFDSTNEREHSPPLEIRISKSDKSRPIKTKNNFSHRQKKKLTKSYFLFREGGMMPLPGLESERCVRGCSTAGGSVFSTKISAEKWLPLEASLRW